MHKFTNAIVGLENYFRLFYLLKDGYIFLASKESEEENYDKILIEYGAYAQECDNYENEVFFVN